LTSQQERFQDAKTNLSWADLKVKSLKRKLSEAQDELEEAWQEFRAIEKEMQNAKNYIPGS